MNYGFESAAEALSDRIRREIEFLPESIKENIEEIRIRSDLPLAFTLAGQTYFLRKDGNLCAFVTRDLVIADKNDLNETFLRLCNHSVYAHCEELKEGFIMLKSGNRAGVCGSYSENGAFRNITSLNIRIAHEVKGCADRITSLYSGSGLLIAGPPGSGKTTLLRDLIRQLSDGTCGLPKRVSVIDSRGEISGGFGSKPVNDLGVNTDVIMMRDKSSGIEMALRTMFPDIVAFDEIGTEKELMGVAESFNAGISVITTAHAGSISELYKRNVTNTLINSGVIGQICMLAPSFKKPFTVISVKKRNEKEYA